MYGRICDLGMEPHPARVLLVSRTLAKQQSANSIGVPTPCGAVSFRVITVFVPGSSELYMYGRVYEQGMGIYQPRVRWKTLAVGPAS